MEEPGNFQIPGAKTQSRSLASSSDIYLRYCLSYSFFIFVILRSASHWTANTEVWKTVTTRKFESSADNKWVSTKVWCRYDNSRSLCYARNKHRLPAFNVIKRKWSGGGIYSRRSSASSILLNKIHYPNQGMTWERQEMVIKGPNTKLSWVTDDQAHGAR